MIDLTVQIANKNRIKGHLINVLGTIFLTSVSLILLVYVLGSMRVVDKGSPAPIAIQSIANNITEQLGIKPITVEIRHIKNIAAASCPFDDSACKIIIDEKIASHIWGQPPVITGIIAHEIGHIVEPQTPKYLQLLPIFLAINLVLLIYLYLAGWRYTLLVFSTLSISMFLIGINAESSFPPVNVLLAFLLLLGSIVWPIQLKSKLKILATTIIVAALANQILKYQLRGDEINADLFSLKIVGKASTTQMFCFLKEEMNKENLSTTDRIYLEWIDTHPSIAERFATTKTSSTDCL